MRSIIHKALALSLSLAGAALAAGDQAHTWSFDKDPVGRPPAGFSFGRTGSGADGRWVIVVDKTAPSGGTALAQVDQDDTDYRFPVAVADEPALQDVDLTVRCKAVSGKVDQGMGLVARYRNANNYYVARANALEDNVNLYKLVDGRRSQISGWNGKVESGTWHTLRLVAQGDHLRVFFNGRPVIDAHDSTFKAAGRVGVWTKADSVTDFDDLTAATPKK